MLYRAVRMVVFVQGEQKAIYRRFTAARLLHAINLIYMVVYHLQHYLLKHGVYL